MDFIQPTEEIVTSKTQAEAAKVAQLRNNATIIESEVNRLKGLVVSEQYTISQLGKEKAELENSIPTLQTQKESLESTVTELQGAISALETTKTALEESIRVQQEKSANDLVEVQKTQKELDVAIENVGKAKKELESEQAAFLLKEKDLQNKINQLKDLIN